MGAICAMMSVSGGSRLAHTSGVLLPWRVAFIVLLLAICRVTWAASVPITSPSGSALSQACVFAGPRSESPAALLGGKRSISCAKRAENVSAPTTYALFNRLNIATDGAELLELRHNTYQVVDEQVWLRYADGTVKRSPTHLRDAQHGYSPGMLVYALPPSKARLTALLIVAEGMQHQRGIATNAEVLTHSQRVHDDAVAMIVFAMLAGAIFALLAYNLALYKALKYRFILAYCISANMVLLVGFLWIGGIYYLYPAISVVTELSLALLCVAFFVMSLAYFLYNFIEREHLDVRLMRIIVCFALSAILMSVTRLVNYPFAWRWVDGIYYGSIAAALIGMIICAGIARRRGSRSAQYFLVAWSIPIGAALARGVWGLGVFDLSSVFAEISPIFIMTLESMTSAIAISWRIGQLRAERDEALSSKELFQALAETDGLTGLLNRRTFLERAREGVQFKQLILIDIDDFKSINDTFGHDVGDQVIVAVARALEAESSEYCLVGRMGGEEFGVILHDLAPFLAQRMCDAISQIDVVPGVLVTASAGVAIGPINSAEEWRELYIAADVALYQAKRTGRNRVCASEQSVAA